DSGRDTYNDAGAYQGSPVVRLVDEMAEHRLRHLEIGDDPVLHRTDGDNVAGRSPEHLLGLFADGKDLLCARCAALDGDDGRFVRDDAFPSYEGQRRRSSEIDGKVVRKQPVNPIKQHGPVLPLAWRSLCNQAETVICNPGTTENVWFAIRIRGVACQGCRR